MFETLISFVLMKTNRHSQIEVIWVCTYLNFSHDHYRYLKRNRQTLILFFLIVTFSYWTKSDVIDEGFLFFDEHFYFLRMWEKKIKTTDLIWLETVAHFAFFSFNLIWRCTTIDQSSLTIIKWSIIIDACHCCLRADHSRKILSAIYSHN
jgi:hypothetical protein